MASSALSRPRLSLGWLSIPNATPLQHVAAAADAGFDSVGIRVARRPTDNAPGIADDPELVEAMRHALSRHRVSVLQMGSLWLDASQPMANFEQPFEVGASLGARMAVMIATPHMPQGRLVDDFAELCELANIYGIRIAIEFAVYSGVRNIEEANALIDRSGQRNAGILVDALHLYRSGGSAAAVAAIAAVDPARIYFAQLCDAAALAPEPSALQTEARGNRLDPGQGELPLDDLMRALPPHTAIELEVPCLAYRNIDCAERARIAYEATRSFIAAMDGSGPGPGATASQPMTGSA